MVCELCASRATHVGWLREAEAPSPSTSRLRRRSAKTLLGRLRQLREREPRFAGPVEASPAPEQIERELLLLDEQLPKDPGQLERLADQPIGQQPNGEHPPVAEPPDQWPSESIASVPSLEEPPAVLAPVLAPTSGELEVGLAIEIFNASQLPARIAGIARSLGEPCVSARALAPASNTVTITVAWELCWYRYEVDLCDEARGPRLVAEGTELDQLGDEDRIGGINADELGELAAELA